MLAKIRELYPQYESACFGFSPLEGAGSNQGWVALLEEGDFDLMPTIDTGDIACGHPYAMKFFRRARFVGTGNMTVIVLVDDIEVARGEVTMADDPTQPSWMRLPRGLAGYQIRFLFCGHVDMRYFDIDWDPVSPSEG